MTSLWVNTDTKCLFSVQALDKLSVCKTPLSRSGATPTLSCLWALTYFQKGLQDASKSYVAFLLLCSMHYSVRCGHKGLRSQICTPCIFKTVVHNCTGYSSGKQQNNCTYTYKSMQCVAVHFKCNSSTYLFTEYRQYIQNTVSYTIFPMRLQTAVNQVRQTHE